MANTKNTFHSSSRRRFVSQAILVSLMSSMGCGVVEKIVLNHPNHFNEDNDFNTSSLKAFVMTVIPGIKTIDSTLIKAYSDPYYPFHKIKGFFIHTLTKMSKNLYGIDRFYALNQSQRTQVVTKGLSSGKLKRQLFKASIAVAQISFYAGIYDARNGCSLIEFNGQNYGYNPSTMFYKNPENLMANEITSTGNYI